MYLCLFAGALLLALWLLQIVFLDSFYKAYKRAELKKATDALLRRGFSWREINAAKNRILGDNDYYEESI